MDNNSMSIIDEIKLLKVFLVTILLFVRNKFKYKTNDSKYNYKLAKDLAVKVTKSAKVNLKCQGKENIPESSAVLIVSNHRSFFDIFTYVVAVDRPMGFIADKKLFKVPILKQNMQVINCVFITSKQEEVHSNREEQKNILQEQKNIIDLLTQNSCLTIFPEGRCWNVRGILRLRGIV